MQDPIAGVSGYSTRIYGALVGVDNWVSPFFRLGIAGGWGHTGIDGRDDTIANCSHQSRDNLPFVRFSACPNCPTMLMQCRICQFYKAWDAA